MSANSGYPPPKSNPAEVARSDVRQWLEAKHPGQQTDFVIIDLRRDDYKGGTIRGTINLPAQTLYPSIPTLYAIFSAAGIKKVVWYCGSCGGRGTRAAGWFADYLKQVEGEKHGMESFILQGGIKGWVAAGEEYTKLMDDYDAAAWAN